MTTNYEHNGHDQWPLISRPGVSWCRTCQVHFIPAPVDGVTRCDCGCKYWDAEGRCIDCGDRPPSEVLA